MIAARCVQPSRSMIMVTTGLRQEEHRSDPGKSSEELKVPGYWVDPLVPSTSRSWIRLSIPSDPGLLKYRLGPNRPGRVPDPAAQGELGHPHALRVTYHTRMRRIASMGPQASVRLLN